MKKIAFCALAMLIMLVMSQVALAAKGEVVKKSGDWFLVETPNGFAFIEWYGGNDPDVGDTIVGDFESFGFKDVYNSTAEDELHVWVEDFWLSKARALEKFYEKCKLRQLMWEYSCKLHTDLKGNVIWNMAR